MNPEEEARAAKFRADVTAGVKKRFRDRFYGNPGDPVARRQALDDTKALLSYPGFNLDYPEDQGVPGRGRGREVL